MLLGGLNPYGSSAWLKQLAAAGSSALRHCNRGPPLAIISTIADRGTRGSAVFKRQLAAGMQSAAVN